MYLRGIFSSCRRIWTEGAFAAGECYLPEHLKDMKFYEPNERGMEGKIKQKLDYLEQQNQQSSRRRYR